MLGYLLYAVHWLIQWWAKDSVMRAVSEQDAAAERAWNGLATGATLHQLARREELNPQTLDQWIWSWRAKATRPVMRIPNAAVD